MLTALLHCASTHFDVTSRVSARAFFLIFGEKQEVRSEPNSRVNELTICQGHAGQQRQRKTTNIMHFAGVYHIGPYE